MIQTEFIRHAANAMRNQGGQSYMYEKFEEAAAINLLKSLSYSFQHILSAHIPAFFFLLELDVYSHVQGTS